MAFGFKKKPKVSAAGSYAQGAAAHHTGCTCGMCPGGITMPYIGTTVGSCLCSWCATYQQQYSQGASVQLATHHQGCYCGTCGGQYSGVAGYISGCFCASCVQPQRQSNAQVYGFQHGRGSGIFPGSTAMIFSTTSANTGGDVSDSYDAIELEELRDRVKFLEMEVSEEEQKLIEIIRREKITAEELEMLVSLKRIQI